MKTRSERRNGEVTGRMPSEIGDYGLGIEDLRKKKKEPGRMPVIRGMTLVELIVVMALIAAMTAISLPSYYRITRGAKLQNSVRMVTEALCEARIRAITLHRSTYVEFNTTDSEFRIKYVVNIRKWRANEKGEFDWYYAALS